MDEDTPICMWKGRVGEFLSENPSQRWVSLKVCKGEERVNDDHEAGMIQLKLSCARKPD